MRHALGPNMKIDQDPPEDARDNFGDDRAKNPRGGEIQNLQVPNPRMQFSLREMKEIISQLILWRGQWGIISNLLEATPPHAYFYLCKCITF